MKPHAVIVSSDIQRHAQAVDTAIRRVTTTREAAAKARLELGRALIAARSLWKGGGRAAKGWSEFVAARGLDMSVALDAMKYAGYVEQTIPGYVPGDDAPDLPTLRDAGIDRRPLSDERETDPGRVLQFEQPAPPESPPAPSEVTEAEVISLLDRLPAEARKRLIVSEAEREVTAEDVTALIDRLDPGARKRLIKQLRPVNASGGSGEVDRGAWCTSAKWAEAAGPWDLDPFSNPRSQIVAATRCMLEDGGNGMANPALPGTYRSGADGAPRVATANTRVWIQPPYSILKLVVAHYGHTRFCALLRFDPSTEWFAALWERTVVVAIPLGDREMFEPPPGISASSNPHAHAFYYSDVRDVTSEIRRLCIVLRRDEAVPALQIVR